MTEVNAVPILSVVIPVFNRPIALSGMLTALLRQVCELECDFGRRCEVIIADDGSALDIEHLVLKSLSGVGRDVVRWVRMPRNLGRAGARNAGAALAEADRLLFLDCDSYPGYGMLARHCGVEDSVVLVGRRLEAGWNTLASMIAAEGREPDIEAFEEDFRVSYLGFDADLPRLSSSPAPWLNAYGHNISVAAALFKKVGGFDEAMHRWGHEDIELGLRLFKAGATFRYDRAAFCAHLPHSRDIHGDRVGAKGNLHYIKRKHQCLDTELLGNVTYTNIERKIGYYNAAINGLRSHASRVTSSDILAEIENLIEGTVLWIGCRLELKTRDGDVALDHDLGESLLGLDTPFPDNRFDVVVNIDLWRILAISDLCLAVTEGLRVARTLVLVNSSRPGEEAPPLWLTGSQYIEEALTSQSVKATTVHRARFYAVILRSIVN